MWNLPRFILLLTVFAVGVVAVDLCPENGRLYSIASGDTLHGEVSSPTGGMCGGASLVTLSPPDSPSLLLLTGGWTYLFGAVANDSLPATVNFSLSARCDGVEVCRANISFGIDPSISTDEPLMKENFATAIEAQRYPPCAASSEELQLVVPPGKPHIASLTTSAVQVECPDSYSVSITQPEMGSAALLGPSSLQFVYFLSDDDLDLNVTLPYNVSCDKFLICTGEMRIWVHQTVPRCPKNPALYDVSLGGKLNASFVPNASCDGTLRGRVRSKGDAEAFKFGDGLFFTFNAPEKEENVVVDARLYCDDEILCDVTFAFVVTNETRPKATEPPKANTTEMPSLVPVAMCKEQFNFTVPTGKVLRDTLHVDALGCSLVTYHQPSYYTTRNLQVNIIGDFFYTAPVEERVEVLPVDISCITEFRCRTYLSITSYKNLSNTPVAPGSPSTPTPTPVCADVYYYRTEPGVAFHNSLNGMPGQDACAHGRYFSVINLPDEGELELTPVGDFLYRPEKHEATCAFSFNMYCLNKLYCQGNARIVVSNSWTPPPPLPRRAIANKRIKCRGTCNERAWKTYPNLATWDNTPGPGHSRVDGHAVDELQVAWVNNSLVIILYTLIGNLGARFPTFESFDRVVGKYLEPKDFEGVVKPTSLGFELSCLAHQGTSGIGEEVWRWKTLGNGTGTGSVGSLYNKGTSWYQKFGGKHVECDTFVDSCRYAPLLTPAVPKADILGGWEIEINNCEATWTGTFPYASLGKLRRLDGSPVWHFVGDKQMRGSIISEGVRANSWIEPTRGFDVQYEVHDVTFGLQQFVVANKLTEGPFSMDLQFFEYTQNGDFAFGVNLLLYPYVTEGMEANYAEDHHVVGFRWITQDWIAPNAEQCPTCQGNQSHCKGIDKYTASTYMDEFPSGDCSDGTSRVELRKGPAMDIVCPPSPMHVYNRSGFSSPWDCATSYQNLTIRGTAIGSGALSDTLKQGFNYEGRVVLQLLMMDGTRHRVAIDFSMYMTRFARNSYVAQGRLSVCRGSYYWPVLDPLGTSLSEKPFELSTASPGPLCIDLLSSTFGLGEWATVFLQLPGIGTSQVNVHSVALNYNGTSVYLLYQNPVTGAAAVPPESAGYWWRYTHPFLSFRDLTNRVANGSLTTGPAVSPSEVADAPFAFAFIPGAINVGTNVEISVKVTVTTDVVSTSIFRRMIRVDPMLTERSRHGLPNKSALKPPDANKKNALAVGALVGLLIALTITGVIYMTMDNTKPLPSWVPRGKMIRDRVLAVVPARLRGRKREGPIVHKDMYDAMTSGKY